MFNTVISTIERYQMLARDSTVTAALSGGADSMALIDILGEISREYRFKVIAAHVNHGLRGEEAFRDERFVGEYCKENGIELRILHADVTSESKKTGEGIEECGRRIRYDFFRSLSPKGPIATAHTLNDSLETALFNLSRGTALKGLCGIPPVRNGIIRPLIQCTRKEVELYCRSRGIPYITDSSNFDTGYSRNRIRMLVIPQLELINPSLTEAFKRCAQSLSEDEELLDALAKELAHNAEKDRGYDTLILKAAQPSIRKRAVAHIIFQNTGKAADNKTVTAVDGLLTRNGKITIHNGVIARAGNGTLDFPVFTEDPPWETEFKPGFIKLPYATVEVEIINKSDTERLKKIHKSILDSCIDYDKIKGNAFIRNRRAGDTVRLSSNRCTKSLKKLFNEKKVPPEERDKIAIVTDSEGVVFIERLGCAERCAVTADTQKLLKIGFRRI